MPLKLDVSKILHGKSERVKCVDIHPTEPWILAALYSGNVLIWNYLEGALVRTFEVSEVPVRCAAFIVRKNWLVVGTDDMHIRVYNYNTCAQVVAYEAHSDYIRSIAVHPSLPLLLSASDDMSIKLWDWDHRDADDAWTNTLIFEGHTHYVMQVALNPRDSNLFASASLDRSIKVWGLNSSVPHFQLEGHERGVNCVSYDVGNTGRPFLASGADDNTVKIWDYQTKTCIATLQGHTANISAVVFHPQLPIILSGSEDGSIKIWHANTYRLETTLHYAMERVWAMCALPNSLKVAIGFDEGTIMLSLGEESPIHTVSMDSSGKVVWAKNHEIQLTKIRRGRDQEPEADGEALQLTQDDLGSTEFYPSFLKHNKNGQLIAVCGDGEYTIYTSLRLKHKCFGEALDFAWSTTQDGSSCYAAMTASSKIKIFKQFKELKTIRTAYAIKRIFGGYLLGVASEGDIYFYHWDDATCIRRIDLNEVTPTNVFWSPEGTRVAIACPDNYYVLKYREEVVDKYIANAIDIEEQGIETAFELEQDVNEQVTSGCYSGEILIYTNSAARLNYYIGGQVITLTHLDSTATKQLFVLGYIQKANRVYLIDKRHNIVSYELVRYVLAYQDAIVREDFRTADMLVKKKKIGDAHMNKLAHFLEAQGHKEMALKVSLDAEHQFELALSLKRLELAKQILLKSPSPQKWRQLGDLALASLDFVSAEEAALECKDLALLYLLYTATNDEKGLRTLVQMAIAESKLNVAFNALYYLGATQEIVELLLSEQVDAVPQCAMFCRAYCPERVDEVQALWKQRLQSISPAAAKALGNTKTHPQCFPKAGSYARQHTEVAMKEQESQPGPAVVQQRQEAKVEPEPERQEEKQVKAVEPEPEPVDTKDDDVEDLSDDISLPSGVDDDDGVLNGDDDDDDFELDDI